MSCRKPARFWGFPRGSVVALPHGLSPDPALHTADARRDGYGSRRIEHDSRSGASRCWTSQPCLRPRRPSRRSDLAVVALQRTGRRRCWRRSSNRTCGDTLSVTTAAPDGVTLEDPGALEFGTVSLSDEGIVELATVTIRAVAAMHELPGAPTHGALTPAHVLFCCAGGCS